MTDLKGVITLVTGASKGVGKGIALGLGEAKAIVYVTSRKPTDSAKDLPGSLADTVSAVNDLGGDCTGIFCDHSKDEDVSFVFEKIAKEHGRLDVLVNNAWGGYENMSEQGKFTWNDPFWEQPLWRWDAMFQNGVRAAFVASRFAAPIMISKKNGLIVNISNLAAKNYLGNTIYGVSKAATDKLGYDMAEELRSHNVAVVNLYPGLVRTERVLQAREFLDLKNSESPLHVGRAVAALAKDPNIMLRSGKTFETASLAKEYGFSDIQR